MAGKTQEASLLAGKTIEFPQGLRTTLYVEVDTSQSTDTKIEIAIPEGLSLVDYPLPEVMPALISSIDMSQFATKNYGGYVPGAGTITYTVTDAAPKVTLELVIKKDAGLWNELELDELDEQIKVRVYSGSKTAPVVHDEAAADVSIVADAATDRWLAIYGACEGVPCAPGKSNRFMSRVYRMQTTGYCKELKVEMALPHFDAPSETAGGKPVTKYARFAKMEYPRYRQTNFVLDPTVNKDCKFTAVEDLDKHTVTFTWENLYMSGFDYFVPYFYWEEDAAPANDALVSWYSDQIPTVLFYGKDPIAIGDPDGQLPAGTDLYLGHIAVASRTMLDGTTVYLKNTGLSHRKSGGKETFSAANQKAKSAASVTVGNTASVSPSTVNWFSEDPDRVYCFGSFRFKNDGGDDSAAQVVDFIYKNTAKIGVTAQRIPTANPEHVTIQYKKKRAGADAVESDFIKYEGDLASDDGISVLFTAQMAGLEKDEYFTQIKANIGKLPRGYMGYQHLFVNYATEAGAVFGKFLTRDTGTDVLDVCGCTVRNATRRAASVPPSPSL